MNEPKAEDARPEDLHEAAIQLTNLAKNQGVNAAVVGGFAGILFGIGRGTGDLDMTADAPLVEGVERGEPLMFGGETVIAPNGVPTDWILRADEVRDLYEEALETAEETGKGYRRVRPEYWVAMKLFAGREKDCDDIIALARLKTFTEKVAARAKTLVQQYLGGRHAVSELASLLEQAKL